MAIGRSLLAALLFGVMANANPLILERQTTSGAATTTAPAGGLIQTTIDGKLTTISLVAPTGTGATTTAATTSTASGDSQSSSAANASPSSISEAPSLCDNKIDQPICSPAEGQTLEIGNSYFFTWSPNAFEPNTTIMIGLEYNNASSRVAFLSEALPKERSLTLVTIEKEWLDGWDQLNLTLIWSAYKTGTQQGPGQHRAYNVTIVPKPMDHLPADIHRGKPDMKSLIIALPIVLGFLLLVVIGLFFGMRSHRKIGLGSIMGRGRRGYGTNKSRRQRLGIKKGAIRLEEREVSPDDMRPAVFEEPDTRHQQQHIPTTAPQIGLGIQRPQGQMMHERDLSFGSLMTDGSARNSYRTDLK